MQITREQFMMSLDLINSKCPNGHKDDDCEVKTCDKCWYDWVKKQKASTIIFDEKTKEEIKE